jgi:very-short-patch-repair endonuclease
MAARSTARLDRALAWLASRQHGVVARRQLLALGFSKAAIAGRIRAGRLIPIHAGVYLVGHGARPPLATEMAAVLACGPDAVVSHRSAAALWRLIDAPQGDCIAVTVPRTWAPVRPGICVHRAASLTRRDRRLLRRVPISSPARTLLDLAALVELPELESLVADAERRTLIHTRELADQLERNPGRRGAATLRRLLERIERPALTRSEAERKMLATLRAGGLPSPQTNVWIAGFQVDFVWARAWVIVEVDGFAFHADRAAFERDRRRDAELQAHGYRTIRITWRQLVDDPSGVLDRIARTLAISAREVDRASIPGTIPR